MTTTTAPTATKTAEPIFSIAWDTGESALVMTASAWVIGAGIVAIVLFVLWRVFAGGFAFENFEIDQADIGIGDQKFTFKPNMTDKQVAYAIWVELSTRKIGLEIDFENDVISEIYDSWFGFFTVTCFSTVTYFLLLQPSLFYCNLVLFLFFVFFFKAVTSFFSVAYSLYL